MLHEFWWLWIALRQFSCTMHYWFYMVELLFLETTKIIPSATLLNTVFPSLLPSFGTWTTDTEEKLKLHQYTKINYFRNVNYNTCQNTYYWIREAATDLNMLKSTGKMVAESLLNDNNYWETVNLCKLRFSKMKMHSM